MKYQIDQSIKIENTAKATYVCISNDVVLIASIPAKEKRTLKLYFRELDRPLIFRLFTFSVICAALIAKTRPRSVTIDREYVGHEINIESFITQILTIWKVQLPRLNFGEIGKGSPAHLAGYQAFKHREKGETITAKKVLILYNLINKT